MCSRPELLDQRGPPEPRDALLGGEVRRDPVGGNSSTDDGTGGVVGDAGAGTGSGGSSGTGGFVSTGGI